MSQSSLKILIIVDNPQHGGAAANQLNKQGVDAVAVAVTDSPTSDADITTAAKSKNWDGYIVGKPIQQNQEWFGRIKKLVTSESPNAAFVDPKSRDDLENAIEHHFNVKFPITKA